MDELIKENDDLKTYNEKLRKANYELGEKIDYWENETIDLEAKRDELEKKIDELETEKRNSIKWVRELIPTLNKLENERDDLKKRNKMLENSFRLKGGD